MPRDEPHVRVWQASSSTSNAELLWQWGARARAELPPSTSRAAGAARSARRAAPREASAGGFTCRSPPGSLRRRHAQRPPEASLTTAPSCKVAPQASPAIALRGRLRRRLPRRASFLASMSRSSPLGQDCAAGCVSGGAIAPPRELPSPMSSSRATRWVPPRPRAALARELAPQACANRRTACEPRAAGWILLTYAPRVCVAGMSHRAASGHVTPRHAAPRHATPRHAAPRRATPRHAASRHATPPPRQVFASPVAVSRRRLIATSLPLATLPASRLSPRRPSRVVYGDSTCRVNACGHVRRSRGACVCDVLRSYRVCQCVPDAPWRLRGRP